LVLPPLTAKPLEDFRPSVAVLVFVFLRNVGKSFSRVAQTGNNLAELINEFKEAIKKILFKMAKRFPIKKVATCLRFEVPTAVVIGCSVFWDITVCSPLKTNRRFGAFRLHLHV
jgi:hypothetical protein